MCAQPHAPSFLILKMESFLRGSADNALHNASLCLLATIFIYFPKYVLNATVQPYFVSHFFHSETVPRWKQHVAVNQCCTQLMMTIPIYCGCNGHLGLAGLDCLIQYMHACKI